MPTRRDSFDLVIPLPAGKQNFKDAFDVFKVAVMRRKQSIVLAVIATFVVNVIALVTSLYSMQVYDRVVPRGAFSTLWVLSVGAIAALAFRLCPARGAANLLERDAVADRHRSVGILLLARVGNPARCPATLDRHDRGAIEGP
jgi:ATP-binding cassette subfamily C protein LapB